MSTEEELQETIRQKDTEIRQKDAIIIELQQLIAESATKIHKLEKEVANLNAVASKELQETNIQKDEPEIDESVQHVLITRYQPQDVYSTTIIHQLEKEVENLKAEKARLETELNETKDQLHSLQTSHDELHTAHDELHTAHDDLKTAHNELQISHDKLSKDVNVLKGKECILTMAQVGQVFQEKCYEYVFAPKQIPEGIRSHIHSYNVRKLPKNIKKTELTVQEKKKANEKWEQLKNKLKLKEKDLKTIEDLKELRNINPAPAHPVLTREMVEKDAAIFLSERSDFSPADIQKLKDMWITTLEQNNVPLA